MQVNVIICIVACSSLLEITQSVIQYKKRAPVSSSRLQHPLPPPYVKSKWPMPPRPPSRPYARPIPVHMASYKVPIIVRPPKTSPPLVQTTPLIFPSAVWKTPTAIYRPPVEKPFLISPPVTQPYEFHINKEPVGNIPTIKQIGEKGPIHTIPAPNLSPADKPNVIFEEPAQKHTYQHIKESEISPNAISPQGGYVANSLLGPQALPLVSEHQYQVTENAEPSEQLIQQQNPFTAQKTYYAPDPDQNILLQKLTQYTDSSSLGSLGNNLKLIPQDVYATPQLQSNLPSISAQELYQLLNAVPQQQLLDNYGMPAQQQQLQQHFIQPTQNYQTFLNNPQLMQPASAYFNQIPETITQGFKDNFKPQFQTFNYEEQSTQHNLRKDFAQSRVTADYNIEPEAVESHPKATVQNPQEALAQTQYIQQYFTNREDNVSNNDLDSQDENKNVQILNHLSSKNEISPSMFYSSLPSRQAAETLATLQAAGNLNSNLLKLRQQQQKLEEQSNHKDQMRIYVPDDDNYEEMESQATGESAKMENQNSQGIRIYETTHLKQNSNSRSDESVEYDDYSNEDDTSLESEKVQDSDQFGGKIKQKTTR